jgi:hypothetical protein
MEHGHALDVGWLPELSAALDCTTTYLLGMTEDPHGWQPSPATNSILEPLTPVPEAPDRDNAGRGDVGGGGTDTDDTATTVHHGWILGPNVPDRKPAGG